MIALPMRATSVAVALLAAACASAPVRPAALANLDRAAASPLAREVQRDAPAAYAEVARAIQAAEAVANGPPVVAQDRALDAQLTLEWAATQARGARARTRTLDAEHRRGEAESDAGRMELQAASIVRSVEERQEAERAVMRARTATANPAAVSQTERATAAADVLQQAELVLAAASLLGADTAARDRVTALIRAARETVRGADSNVALVAAGRAFAAADALVHQTRAGHEAPAGATDAAQLVSELSQAGGVEPRRDVRGVIAVMRGLFTGAGQVAPAARTRIESIGRVIQGHADAHVRIEAYVGGTDAVRAERTALTQAQNVVAALVHAGVPATRLEAAGLHRLTGAGRSDDQVEVVLVLPAEP